MKITRWRLAGHFGQNKTIEAVEHHFYWPSLKRDIVRLANQCLTCQLAMQRKQNIDLYTLLPVSNCPLQDIIMGLMLALPKTARKYDSILIVVDHFSKMGHFLPCSKMSDVSRIAMIYFDEVFRLHELPKIIISDRDVKLTSYF